MPCGRPAKKPGYDRTAEIKKLINRAVELAVKPFDDTSDRDTNLPTLTEIAEAMGTTLMRVRKLLITGKFYTSPVALEVQKLNAQGMSIEDIMKTTGLGKASVYSYLPYKKGAYNLESPTLFSEQGKRYRARKAVLRDLLGHRNLPDELVSLWKTVIAFENYLFTTSGRGSNPGVRFKYEVSKEGKAGGRHYRGDSVDGYGNEMWIIIDGVKREKSISRSTVDLAYKKAQELMKTDGYVSGPKKLGIPGAGSYLYAMLLSWGIISREATNFSSNV